MARVVNVSVCQKDHIYFVFRNGEVCIFKNIEALFHTVVNEYFVWADFKVGTASRYLVSCADEHNFHSITL